MKTLRLDPGERAEMNGAVILLRVRSGGGKKKKDCYEFALHHHHPKNLRRPDQNQSLRQHLLGRRFSSWDHSAQAHSPQRGNNIHKFAQVCPKARQWFCWRKYFAKNFLFRFGCNKIIKQETQTSFGSSSHRRFSHNICNGVVS